MRASRVDKSSTKAGWAGTFGWWPCCSWLPGGSSFGSLAAKSAMGLSCSKRHCKVGTMLNPLDVSDFTGRGGNRNIEWLQLPHLLCSAGWCSWGLIWLVSSTLTNLLVPRGRVLPAGGCQYSWATSWTDDGGHAEVSRMASHWRLQLSICTLCCAFPSELRACMPVKQTSSSKQTLVIGRQQASSYLICSCVALAVVYAGMGHGMGQWLDHRDFAHMVEQNCQSHM